MGSDAEREMFEVYAIRYARNDNRTRGGNFIFQDDLHDQPMPLDYYIWLIKNDKHAFVIDSGCTARHAAERGVNYLRTPAEGLATMGVDAATVTDVILTHMHYDHAGGLENFPAAKIHVQDGEMAYATGRCMCFEPIRKPFDVEDVTAVVRKLYDGRVQFHDGDQEIMPGLSLHRIGGHSAGLMCVRVWTQRGWMIVASDCAHFYENLREQNPFVICLNLAEMMTGYNTMNILADSPDHIIPGHDPMVREIYPALSPEHEGIVNRLDVAPSKTGLSG